MDEDLETGLDADEPMSELTLHHPGLDGARRVLRPLADRDARPVRALRRLHRVGDRLRHARRHDPRGEAGAGLAHDHAAGADAGLRRRARHRVDAPAAAARRSRCSSRRPTWRSSTGGARRASSSAPTSRRRMRAGSSSCEWRNWSARNPGGPASRGRGSGSRRGSSTTRSGGWCWRCCCPSCAASALIPDGPVLLARPSAHRAHPHHGVVGADRGAAHRLGGHDARQVAVRRLPAILDFRCVCAARHARATRARAARVVPRLVGRRRLRLSAAGPGADRRRLREDRAEPGDGLGLRAGRAGDARAAGRAQHGDRRLRPGRDVVALWRRMAPADGRVDRVGAHDDRRRVAVGEHVRRRDLPAAAGRSAVRGRRRPWCRRAFRQRRRR